MKTYICPSCTWHYLKSADGCADEIADNAQRCSDPHSTFITVLTWLGYQIMLNEL